MAEERKKGAAALYGKPPKIENDSREGDTPKSGGGAPDKAMDKAKETAGSPKSEAKVEGDMKSGTEAKGDVMTGTDGIMVHHTQSGERDSQHHGHMLAHAHMHSRHQQDHLMRAMGHHSEDMKAMHERHHNERRSLHTVHERETRDMHGRHEGMAPSGGIEQKTVGDEGTEK